MCSTQRCTRCQVAYRTPAGCKCQAGSTHAARREHASLPPAGASSLQRCSAALCHAPTHRWVAMTACPWSHGLPFNQSSPLLAAAAGDLALNPWAGPEQSALLAVGAQEATLVMSAGQWWRLFSSPFVNAGVIQVGPLGGRDTWVGEVATAVGSSSWGGSWGRCWCYSRWARHRHRQHGSSASLPSAPPPFLVQGASAPGWAGTAPCAGACAGPVCRLPTQFTLRYGWLPMIVIAPIFTCSFDSALPLLPCPCCPLCSCCSTCLCCGRWVATWRLPCTRRGGQPSPSPPSSWLAHGWAPSPAPTSTLTTSPAAHPRASAHCWVGSRQACRRAAQCSAAQRSTTAQPEVARVAEVLRGCELGGPGMQCAAVEPGGQIGRGRDDTTEESGMDIVVGQSLSCICPQCAPTPARSIQAPHAGSTLTRQAPAPYQSPPPGWPLAEGPLAWRPLLTCTILLTGASWMDQAAQTELCSASLGCPCTPMLRNRSQG